MSDDPKLTDAQLKAVAERITRVGKTVAAMAMVEAARSPDIALAIIGVAAGQIIGSIDADRRAEVLRNYLESFGDTADDAG
jgi:hypothetical protein